MGKLKFYVLTSGDLLALSRHTSSQYSNIPKEDLFIVINTTDKKYEKAAIEYCEQERIEYCITDSDGSASRGKNSVLEIFLNSDNDYMVQIDGDDYLTPHGVWLYKHLAESDSPPDAIALMNQMSYIIDNSSDILKTERFVNEPEKYLNDRQYEIPTVLARFFDFDYELTSEYDYISELISRGVPKEKAKLYSEANRKFYKNANRYCQNSESHHRVTWLSKVAAAMHKYPEGHKVGEDTLFFYLLKNESSLGKIDFKINDEYPATYIYDQRIPSTVVKEVEGGTNWQWMVDFNDAVEWFESAGVMSDDELPLLKIDYPHDYVPDSLQTSGNLEYNFDSDHHHKFEFPANASEKSIQEKYNAEFSGCCCS